MSLDDLDWNDPNVTVRPALARPKPHRHDWHEETVITLDGQVHISRVVCWRCGKERDDARSRMGKNNVARGGDFELEVARATGGRKIGPLLLPWDVEGTGFRLQTKKWTQRPSLNAIGQEITRIPFRTDSLRGFVWGQGGPIRGIRLVYVAENEWEMWHGKAPNHHGPLTEMTLSEFVAIHCQP